MAVSDQAVLTGKQIETLSINTIRTLSIDAVEKANSGHPGAPMALAPVAYVLWQQFLRYDPANPVWPNRDRFVLSAGHASMLLYSVLHLAQVKAVDSDYEIKGHLAVTLDDIKTFRQHKSHCAGHPEYRWTSGVETTTGPLGQGVATSVGMAIAAKWLGAHYNRPGFDIFDYNIYALCGDGCMMEGISGEAASLAGHLKLEKLCWIYDSNRVSIEGHTEIAFTENVECEPSFGIGILPNKKIGQRLARFRQVNMDNAVTHHDALEFPDGQVVLLTRLCEGQRASVLQLPASARPAAAEHTAANATCLKA